MNETFDSYTDGEAGEITPPDGWEAASTDKTTKGVRAAVVPGNANNSVRLCTTAKGTAVLKKDGLDTQKTASGTTVIELNVRAESYNVERDVLKIADSNGMEYSVIHFSGDGYVYSEAKDMAVLTPVAEYRTGQWYHFAVAVDVENVSYDLYMDGQQLLDEAYFTDDPLEDIASLQVSQTGQKGVSGITFVDDVRVYLADAPDGSSVTYPKSRYESTVVVPLPANYAGSTGAAGGAGGAVNVIQEFDFENYTADENSEPNSGPEYFDVYDEGGKVYSAVVDEAHGRSVAFRGPTSGYPGAINKDGISSMIQGDTIIEFEMKVDDPAIKPMVQYEAGTSGALSLQNLIEFKASQSIQLQSANGRTPGGSYDTDWHVYSIVFHMESSTYDFYIDYVEQAAGVATPKPITEVKRFKLGFIGSTTAMSYFDNFRIYRADVPQKIIKAESTPSNPVEEVENSVFDSEPDFSGNIANSAALFLGSSNAYANGRRTKIDPENPEIVPLLINDRTLVPIRFISECFGADIVWHNETQSVDIQLGGKEIDIVVNSDVMQVDGSSRSLDSPAVLRDGRVFLPLRAFAEAIGKQVFYDPSGLIVIGDTAEPFPASDADKQAQLVKALRFERPSRQEILQTFQAQNPSGAQHPRILMTQEKFDALKDKVTTDALYQKWYARLLVMADEIIPQPVCEWGINEGSSGDMLWTMREIKKRVETLGLAFKISGEEKYKDRLYDEMVAVANFKNWDEGQHLDVVECSYAFALAYDWLYHDWSEQQRDVIKTALMEKGMQVSMDGYHGIGDSGWTKLESNWTMVCNGANIVCALALMDEEPEFCAAFMEYALRSLEYSVLRLEPEGAWDEGMGYWAYSIRYYVPAIDAMDSVLGTNFGYYDNIQGAGDTGAFQPYMTGPTGNFNYHDAGEGIENASELFWFASRENQPGLNEYRMNLLNSNFENYFQAYDMIWYDPSLDGNDEELPLDKYYTGLVQTALLRSAWNDNAALWGGLHAGPNNVGHTNLDVGTFVLDALGQRWAVDLGMEDYARSGYFDMSGGRFVYYRTRGEGQNTVIVNPGEVFDQDLAAEGQLVKFESKPRGGYAVIDISSTKTADIEQAYRGMMMTDDRQAIILQDEMTLNKPSEVYWFMHTRAEIEIGMDGRSAILTQGGKQMHMQLVSADETLQFDVMKAEPLPGSITPDANNPNNPNAGIQKIFINGSNVTEFNVAVVFTPMPIGIAPTAEREFVPMAEWSIPDGEIADTSYLNLSSLSVGGTPVEGFMPEQHAYTVQLEPEVTQPPEVQADYDGAGANVEVEVVQAESLDENVKVIITDTDTGRQQFYTVDFEQETLPGRPEGMEKYSISSVEVSAQPQPGNPKEHAIDGDINTRWSAEFEQWITADLGEVKPVSAIAVSWYMGKERQSQYDIQVSTNGRRWKTVYSGWSTGQDDFDTSIIPETDVRFVRIRGYGNTINNWVSVGEIEVYGNGAGNSAAPAQE